MIRFALVLAPIALPIFAGAAQAADTSATTTTFALAPLLPILTPLALAALAGVFKWAIGDAAALAAKYLHVCISQADQDAAAPAPAKAA